jgi:hypothetical protein
MVDSSSKDILFPSDPIGIMTADACIRLGLTVAENGLDAIDATLSRKTVKTSSNFFMMMILVKNNDI